MQALVYCLVCPPHWLKTPPLGGEYLKRYAQKKHIEIRIIDLNITLYKLLGTDKKRWLSLDNDFETTIFPIVKRKYPHLLKNIIKKLADAELVGFSLFARNKFFTFSLIREIRNVFPNKKIVVGGPEVLFMHLRKEKFDSEYSWVIGEGETTIEKVLNTKDNVVISFSELGNIDQIPFLEFENYNLSLYSRVLPLYSSRGCIKKCVFCSEKLLFSKFRQHSPLYMAEQIRFLISKYKINTFSFQDSLINANLEWLRNFCLLLLRKNIKIGWEAQIIIRNDFDYNLVKLMKESGCYNLFIGLESGSNKVLKRMDKGFTKEEALNFFKVLVKAELHYEVSLIVGYPGEEDSDFEETVEFITQNKKIIPKIAQINPYIDYFSNNYIPSSTSLKKVEKFVSILQKEKIPYTKSFINNLVYHAN